MAVEKLSLSFEPELAQRTREAAEASGRSVSAFVAAAVEQQLKLDAGRQLLEEWEEAHGPITNRELERVRERWRD